VQVIAGCARPRVVFHRASPAGRARSGAGRGESAISWETPLLEALSYGESLCWATKVPVSLRFAVGKALFCRGRGPESAHFGYERQVCTCRLTRRTSDDIGRQSQAIAGDRTGGREGFRSTKDFGIQPKHTVTGLWGEVSARLFGRAGNCNDTRPH
jgi:hypothetical protein